LNANGRAGVVVPHGVLFRGGVEGRIRKQIIKKDILEAVVALPSKLFYGTGIPAAVLIFNKNKPKEKEGKILIIDAEKDYQEGKNQNKLRNKDIEKIVNAYDVYLDQDKFAKLVDLKTLKENEYNLNVRRYVDSSDEEKFVDVKEVLKDIEKLEKERDLIDKDVKKFLKELKY
jgi:type I restriction enzyme M protein